MNKKGKIKICYKLNKEFSTDDVILSVKARPQFFDEKRLVKEAVYNNNNNNNNNNNDNNNNDDDDNFI